MHGGDGLIKKIRGHGLQKLCFLLKTSKNCKEIYIFLIFNEYGVYISHKNYSRFAQKQEFTT